MKAVSKPWCRCGSVLLSKRLGRLLALVRARSADPVYLRRGFAEGDTRPPRMTLHHDPHFILQAVAAEMNVTLRPDIPAPEILLESATPLRRFQEAISAQWGFRPHVITNAYAVRSNEIYLTDDPAYYLRLKRTLDELLAHELAHYLQVRYLNADLAEESLENDAVAIQVRFSAAHVKMAGMERGR